MRIEDARMKAILNNYIFSQQKMKILEWAAMGFQVEERVT